MKPTMEILERLNGIAKDNHEEVFTRLYRYLLRPDIYYEAYRRLYANKGAATKGIGNDTADGFSEKKINKIIQTLREETFEPTPVRRTYIEKKNSGGKKRPLGIPTFTDKLVQEALKLVLESIYEPVFLECSHGFRPNRGCHTALKQAKNQFMGSRWFIEGDIKGCFDNINHEALIGFMKQKIADARIIKLVYKFLKAGYMENWQYHNTYSGTPQGGIISPLLANIYLHELDKFVMNLKEKYDTVRADSRETKEYRRARHHSALLKKKIEGSIGKEREYLLAEYKSARAEQIKIPFTKQTDKKIQYVRYADDFIIGVKGSHEDCEKIKYELAQFISDSLKMELSREKTLITHSSNYALFLGYNIRVLRTSQIRRGGITHCKMRTLNNKSELSIPFGKIEKFLFNKKVMEQKADGRLVPTHRPELVGCTDLEIVTTYNAELRGICNYYNLASNFSHLNYFSYMMEYSCLKTLANKHKCSISKVKGMFKDGQGKWGIPYETKNGKRRCYFAKYQDCRQSVNVSDTVDNSGLIFRHSVNSFEKKLTAKVCELCGTTESAEYEIHHVNKLKNLKGKEAWEKAMIAKRRKTMVLCKDCHNKIHNQSH